MTEPSVAGDRDSSVLLCFFFSSRRRHTRFDCDWSSDVCSSDLIRKLFRLEDLITVHHFENLAKLCLLTGMIVGYAYCVEYFTAWFGGHAAEQEIGRASCRERV